MDSKTPSTSSLSPPRGQVKKENEEEIKQFAETAMNEFLGWYGYERLELRRWAASRAKDANSPDTQTAEHKDKDECSWCNKNITSDGGALQQSGATFCSELCFSQSRRANFKRAKTCDWCRHVRHTVAYVDFQDGATQLQFCSDKCLNQYKMHIFCRETQAHLDLNPHLVNASSTSNLITPDLWLKNCRSRSGSPISENSRSPIPENMSKPKGKDKTDQKTRKSPIPLITIAPQSKLMKPKAVNEERAQKSPETKRDLRSNKNKKRRTSKCTSTVTSQSVTRHNSTTPKAQDLRTHSPSTIEGSSPSSISNNVIHSPPNTINAHSLPHLHPPLPSSLFGMPPMFMDNIPPSHERVPNMFPSHFIPRMPYQERPSIPPMMFPQSGLGQPPPVTVLVPYPVILPIPLPIPIPLPLTTFLQAHYTRLKPETNRAEESEGPLDFTMNSGKRKDESAPDFEDYGTTVDQVTAEKTDDFINEERLEETRDVNNPEQTLPKFKITRVGNKISKIVTKREQSESTRPLRKRRRLVEGAAEEDNLISKSRKIVKV